MVAIECWPIGVPSIVRTGAENEGRRASTRRAEFLESDERGHLAADRALTEVAMALSQNPSRGDPSVRQGGEDLRSV
jgi:hypothetical protein